MPETATHQQLQPGQWGCFVSQQRGQEGQPVHLRVDRLEHKGGRTIFHGHWWLGSKYMGYGSHGPSVDVGPCEDTLVPLLNERYIRDVPKT